MPARQGEYRDGKDTRPAHGKNGTKPIGSNWHAIGARGPVCLTSEDHSRPSSRQVSSNRWRGGISLVADLSVRGWIILYVVSIIRTMSHHDRERISSVIAEMNHNFTLPHTADGLRCGDAASWSRSVSVEAFRQAPRAHCHCHTTSSSLPRFLSLLSSHLMTSVLLPFSFSLGHSSLLPERPSDLFRVSPSAHHEMQSSRVAPKRLPPNHSPVSNNSFTVARKLVEPPSPASSRLALHCAVAAPFSESGTAGCFVMGCFGRFCRLCKSLVSCL